MPKYRLLTKEELLHFEKEFIEYLVVNGITGEEWKKLKATNLKKAEQITDLFSDVVFEKILREANFLTFVAEKELFTFQCLANEIVLVGVKALQNATVNFLKEIPKELNSIKVFTQTKSYSKIRELELFDMIQNGCTIDNGAMFKQLCLAL